MSEKLKPCPFCGEKLEITANAYSSYYSGPVWKHWNWYRVQCPQCEVQTTEYPTVEEAIEAWNRRAKDDGKNV